MVAMGACDIMEKTPKNKNKLQMKVKNGLRLQEELEQTPLD